MMVSFYVREDLTSTINMRTYGFDSQFDNDTPEAPGTALVDVSEEDHPDGGTSVIAVSIHIRAMYRRTSTHQYAATLRRLDRF
jgi:hypothetical protein